jgi:hypothetical protein
MGGGCFTDVMVHSSGNYYEEHVLPMTTEPRRLLGEEQPACGAVILRFHGVSSQ